MSIDTAPTHEAACAAAKPEVLSAQAIFQLAKDNGLKFRAHYGVSYADDLTPPQPQRITVDFYCENVAAWRTLMTHDTAIPVEIRGTRQVSGNGAIDGTLFPGYRAILDEVNARRAEIGLGRVRR